MPWEIMGNANTNEGINFIGTTDQHALVMKTNGSEAVRIDAKGNVGVGTSAPTAKVEIAGKLQIDAQDAVQIVGFQPFLTLTDSENNSSVRTRIQNARGDLNFFTEAYLAGGNPTMRILNTGTVQMFAQDALQSIGFQPFITLIDSENNSFARTRIQNARGDLNFFTESSLAAGIPPVKISNTDGSVEISNQAPAGAKVNVSGPGLMGMEVLAPQTGVFAEATGPNGIGLEASGIKAGVKGQAAGEAPGRVGVLGRSVIAPNPADPVVTAALTSEANALQSGGRGVLGIGSNVGVQGIATNGHAVDGLSITGTGVAGGTSGTGPDSAGILGCLGSA